jgi:ornithine cyclodeaminase
MQLYSQKTGKIEILLLDDGLLTELRTAAVGAVAARMLAPDLSAKAACIGVLGTGIQARYQLRYLAHVTGCRNVRVWGRTEKNTIKFIEDMESEGWNVTAVDSSQHLLQPPTNDWHCPLIVTTTSSREPLLKLVGGELRRPLHITCIGSDSTGKLELDPKLVAVADLLVADSRIQTRERGEFEDAIKQGLVPLEDITELGELVLKKEFWRSNDNNDARFTVFDSSGVAVQDCIIASMFAQGGFK